MTDATHPVLLALITQKFGCEEESDLCNLVLQKPTEGKGSRVMDR